MIRSESPWVLDRGRAHYAKIVHPRSSRPRGRRRRIAPKYEYDEVRAGGSGEIRFSSRDTSSRFAELISTHWMIHPVGELTASLGSS